ncbi:unnamed protein product [Calypogeia fissa]
MCILGNCEDPTEQGVWWRDDTKWRLYGADHQALIKSAIAEGLAEIDLGTIVSRVHPSGEKYILDLEVMEQESVTRGQRRPVMVVDAPTVEKQRQPRSATLSPTTLFQQLCLNLHYKSIDGSFQRYSANIEQALFQNMMHGSKRTVVVPDGESGHYCFDLKSMEQSIVSHFDVNGEPVLTENVPVKVIVEAPWDAAAMASMAAKADKSLRREIFAMVIERYKSDEHLDSILEVKARPRKVISKSARACSAALHERFIDCLEDVLQTFPDVVGDMIKAVGTKEVEGPGPVQIAFKPVDRERVSSRSKRKTVDDSKVMPKVAFWMSMAAPVAAAHATVYGCAVRILAYLVIIPVASLKKNSTTQTGPCSGYVEVERPEHGLPLAEITVN